MAQYSGIEKKKKKEKEVVYITGRASKVTEKDYIKCVDSCGMKMSHLSANKVNFLYICYLFFFPQDKKASRYAVASSSIYSNIQ